MKTSSPSALTALWSDLNRATERCLDTYMGAEHAEQSEALARLLVMLELRWKLEEQILLPALREGDAALKDESREIAEEIDLLRELADLAERHKLDPGSTVTVTNAVAGIAALRSARIERALEDAERARSIDAEHLAEEVREMFQRWRGEIAKTGDIEDEERDPVGEPPR
jgi:hypothetical protein